MGRAVMKSGRITKLQNTTRKTVAQSVVSIAAVQHERGKKRGQRGAETKGVFLCVEL